MKIGIYGGTFDPPHLGHMEAARTAIDHFGLDRLLLIPNKLPPHKFLPEDGAQEEHRLAMTKICADAIGPRAEAIELELRREGRSYTADTIEILRREFPDAELYLLMGTDMFLSFETWSRPKEIAREVTLVPFFREEGGSHELFAVQSEKLRAELKAKISVLSLTEVHPISSSQIRKLLREAKTQDQGGDLLWPAVYGYILQKKLYGTNADLTSLQPNKLRAISYSMMKAKRIPHVQGAEETAVSLAKRWGVDPELARRAAILHDCTKYLELDEQLALCKKYGILLDELEQKSVKMLHSKTGAALASHVFGETQEVCNAIACHTTGKPDMNTFDKVLYLADYVEPTRDFEGIEELRELAFHDLDKAMILGLETTITELNEKEAPVHQNTFRTLERLRGSCL
jgi:nicotinate-nucleotide adenylyltransferase